MAKYLILKHRVLGNREIFFNQKFESWLIWAGNYLVFVLDMFDAYNDLNTMLQTKAVFN